MAKLFYVPQNEFTRVLGLSCSRAAKVELFSALARINVLYMIKRAGSGHIGTSFSSLDVVSWIYLEELRKDASGKPVDIYFSSKGHDVPGLYAVLTGLGLLDFKLIHELRKLGGLPGHPDVGIPWLHTNTGSLGMGISKAKGMAIANRLAKRDQRIFVLTGDGELQEGQFWESLQGAVNGRFGEITVVVDHNKLQSDTWVKDVSDLGNLEQKLTSFGWRVARCDGHDIAALEGVFSKFRDGGSVPRILIADTVKGKGVRAMEPDHMDPADPMYKFHSGAPSDQAYANGVEELIAAANARLAAANAASLSLESLEVTSPSPPTGDRLVGAYSEALVRVAESNDRVIALDADLVLDTGLVSFKKRFPERFVECGIAEQDMVSMAGGMALKGYVPIVHSFACFLSSRPNEQMYNNATEHTKVIYVGSLAGIVPGGPGHSHQCVRDVSAVGGIPELVAIEPSCAAEVEHALRFAVEQAKGSVYLRLVTVPVQVPYQLPPNYACVPGQGTVLRDGPDALFIASGPVILTEAWHALAALEQKGIRVALVNMPWLNVVDSDWLRTTVGEHEHVFYAENHYLAGGTGQYIGEAIAKSKLPGNPRFEHLGIDRVPSCGRNDEVLRAHALDRESLAKHVARALNRSSAS